MKNGLPAGPAAVEISAIGTESRDLELKSIFQNNDDAEMRADRVSSRKKLLHDFRPRIRRDIDVLGRFAAKQIAHTSAGIVSKMHSASATV